MCSHNGNSIDERTSLLVKPDASACSHENTGKLTHTENSRIEDTLPPATSPDSTYCDDEARSNHQERTEAGAQSSIRQIVSVLLIGSFISNADSSLLYATHSLIASEFNALNDSSWLMISFAVAQAATQPLYGKLSDIYGRKHCILVAYTLFACGLALVGIGQSMSTLIIGRVLSGAGASGMTVLVSILIADLVSLRDVATWRSYVNVVSTTGRSMGGPIGGYLADTVGWRWSFLGQVPLAGIAMILIAITLPPSHHQELGDADKGDKLARTDFLGSILMTLSILCLLFPLQIGGDWLAWNSPIVIGLFIGAIVCAVGFAFVERFWAKEPILPLSLLRQRDIMASDLIMFFLSAGQTGVMFAVPLYFQVTSKVTNTIAGAHLVPAVVGNAIGGILAGMTIRRTGKYRSLIVGATLTATTGYLLLALRWRGNTDWLESLYIFPGGFGMGVAQSALFISIQAATDSEHMATATSTMYLASSMGFTSGMSAVSAVLQQTLRSGLEIRLHELGFDDSRKWDIIEHAISDVHYADSADSRVAHAIVAAYVDALTWTHGML